MSPTTGMDVEAERKPLSHGGNQTSAVQPVPGPSRQSTDSTTLPHSWSQTVSPPPFSFSFYDVVLFLFQLLRRYQLVVFDSLRYFSFLLSFSLK